VRGRPSTGGVPREYDAGVTSPIRDRVSPRLAIPATLAEALANARRVLALTGAGVSAESGIPTFRDALTGLWARFDPLELATPAAFERQPKLVWDWYATRRDVIRAAQPNDGHHALVAIEQRVPAFLLATQNVDGLHARAGSRALVELHGNLARVRCSREGRIVERWDEPFDGLPPRCPHCGAFLRPDVVWFDEMLPARALAQAEDDAARCDLMIVAGTSAEVHPAASLPLIAKAAGARLVEVNPHETPLTRLADHVIRERSGVALPALVAAAWPDSAHADDRVSSPRAPGGGAK
jgi:NAD-dependent deacetylase